MAYSLDDFCVGQIVRCVNVDGDTTGRGVGSLNIITGIDSKASWMIDALDFTSTPGFADEVAYNLDEIEPFTGHVGDMSEAWERLCNYLDAHVETDVRSSVKTAARMSNPYKGGTNG